jgi:hypothetical protein
MTWVAQYLRLTLSKGLTRVGVSLPSPLEGNSFGFQNLVFSGYLEFRMMSEVHKPSDFVIYHHQNPLDSSLVSMHLTI